MRERRGRPLTRPALRFSLGALALLTLVVGAAPLFWPVSPAYSMPFADCPSGTMMVQPGRARACVELAVTEAQRERGLMFRAQLGLDTGMLFVFPEAGLHRMWMKDTWIPLSVAFIDDQGTILNIEDMNPRSLEPHGASQPARYALEMEQGWFARRNLMAGSRVTHLPPPVAE